MTTDPNDTNPADNDSPEVQWMLQRARARHEQRMEHAAAEPAVVGHWLSDIETKEKERRSAIGLLREIVAAYCNGTSSETAACIHEAQAFLDGLSS